MHDSLIKTEKGPSVGNIPTTNEHGQAQNREKVTYITVTAVTIVKNHYLYRHQQPPLPYRRGGCLG